MNKALLLSNLILLFYADVEAHVAPTTCNDPFSWMNDELQQSPCVVASYLLAQCSGDGQYTLPFLAPNSSYSGPDPRANSTDYSCGCSTVVYSLVSACALCQHACLGTWQTWSKNCSTVYDGIRYPDNPPPQMKIPKWANLFNPQTEKEFNVTAAKISANQFNNNMATSTSPNAGVTTRLVYQTIVVSTENGMNLALAGAIGALCALAVAALVGLIAYAWLYRARKRKGMDREMYRPLYEPGMMWEPKRSKSPSDLLDKGSVHTPSRRPSRPCVDTASEKSPEKPSPGFSLPSNLHVTPTSEEVSPAIESSDAYHFTRENASESSLNHQ